MDTQTVSMVALALSALSFVLSAAAYWRASGRADLSGLRAQIKREAEALCARQQRFGDGLTRQIRASYEDSLSRLKRAERRVAALGTEFAHELKHNIDILNRELFTAQQQAEQALLRLESSDSSELDEVQDVLARRVRHLEARLQLLMSRCEMVRAERLAEKGRFAEAENLLEDSVAKVRELKLRFSDDIGDDVAFSKVISALHDAIRSVRGEAEDHPRQIERVVSASDRLLATLETRDREPD